MLDFIRSKTQRWLFSKILLFGGACASLLWSIYFAVTTISIPYPIELREGTAQVITGFLLSRSNPFIFENQPLAMNNYGLGYNLVVAPFAALFGNTLLVHRSVTFVFILLCSITGFLVIYKTKREVSSALACAAFIMIGLITRGSIGAFPSAMGTFLFMMAVLIPFFKSFTPVSLLFSVLFSLVAFYTKPYFVLGFGIVASYLFLFVSKKTGLFYGISFLLLFTISFLAVRFAFPLYFINTVVGNISNTTRSVPHLFSQLKQLSLYFFPILLASILLLIADGGILNKTINREQKDPLIGIPLDCFFYSFLCTLLVFVFFLGLHIGSYLNYAYQLIVPMFFCWFFAHFNHQGKTGLLIVVAVVFNLLFWEKSSLAPRSLEQKNSKEWATLYSYLESSTNILNSPVITSTMIERGLKPIDSGQTAYFYSVKPYSNNAMLGPSYDLFRSDGLKYIKFIDNSIEKQRYDLIFTTTEKSSFYHMKLVEEFYTPITELKIPMPQANQQWTISIWKPKIK